MAGSPPTSKSPPPKESSPKESTPKESSPHEQTASLEPAGQLEADEGNITDNDSALGDNDTGSSTASIASSIYKFRIENGRSYHAYKDGIYVGPNDNSEQDRLDLQHALCLLTFDNQLHLAPIFEDGETPVKRVLDIGTGTGCWAIDFGDDHPEATVVGVDLSPIQPAFVPPNVEFQIDDVEEDWTFSEPFDYIYTRFMTVSLANWPRFFGQSFTNLNPGGWMEVVDILPPTSDDGTMTPETALYQWSKLLLEATEKMGRPFGETMTYETQMEAAGFQNVTQQVFKWPQNRWPKDQKCKELGSWTLENISSGLDGISIALFTRVLGWSKPQLDVFLTDVRKDLKNPSIHAYWPIDSNPGGHFHDLHNVTQRRFRHRCYRLPRIRCCTHIFMNLVPNITTLTSEVPAAKRIIDIAKAAAVKHMIYSSGMAIKDMEKDKYHDPEHSVGRAHGWKKEVENLVKDAGFEEWTILRGGFFMCNFLAPKVNIMCSGLIASNTWSTAYTPEEELPVMDVEDLAKFAVAAFHEPNRFDQQIIEIASEKLSPDEIMQQLGEASGKPLRAVYMTDDEIAVKKNEDIFVAIQLMARGLGDKVDIGEVQGWGIPLTTFKEFLERERSWVESTFT
ncbi:methyltransferase [Fusarium bulbicola]|nr:methyltransferase [Fusarium bulbicola]